MTQPYSYDTTGTIPYPLIMYDENDTMKLEGAIPSLPIPIGIELDNFMYLFSTSTRYNIVTCETVANKNGYPGDKSL